MSKCYFMCLAVKDSSYLKEDELIEAFSLAGFEYDPFEEIIIDVKSFNVKKSTLEAITKRNKDLSFKQLIDELPGKWLALDIRALASSQGGVFNTVDSVVVYNDANFQFEDIDKSQKK